MSKIAKKVVGESDVTLAFADGVKLVAQLANIPQDIVNRLALHGLSQKLGDSYASAGEKGWSISDCRDEAQRVLDNLIGGVWAAKGGGTGVTILAEALARVAGKAIDEAVDVITGLSDDQRKALEKDARIKAAMLDIKAERAKERAEAMTDSDASDLTKLF
jgi:hypothetical protein